MARNKFVKLKATDEEQSRWNRTADLKGEPLSRIIRRYLDSLSARVDREQSVKERASE